MYNMRVSVVVDTGRFAHIQEVKCDRQTEDRFLTDYHNLCYEYINIFGNTTQITFSKFDPT